MSLRICHACISYLNSWQSFKNRCLAAQNKQRSWLENSNKPFQSADQHHQTADSHYDDHQQPPYHHHQQQQQQDDQSLSSSILEEISTLKKRKSLTVYVSPKSQQTKQPEKLLPKPQQNVVMPLTKRHYTKHKYNKSQRQVTAPSQMSQTTTAIQRVQTLPNKTKQKSDKRQSCAQLQTLLSTCSPLQQQSFVVPAVPSVTATATTCTITALPIVTTTATATTCSNATPTSTTVATPTLVASSSSSSAQTVATSAATSAAACSLVSAGSGDESLMGQSCAFSSTIACTSAVQQLRLFRRYSYNVNVSYTAQLTFKFKLIYIHTYIQHIFFVSFCIKKDYWFSHRFYFEIMHIFG